MNKTNKRKPKQNQYLLGGLENTGVGQVLGGINPTGVTAGIGQIASGDTIGGISNTLGSLVEGIPVIGGVAGGLIKVLEVFLVLVLKEELNKEQKLKQGQLNSKKY